jgi:hypothetical protein
MDELKNDLERLGHRMDQRDVAFERLVHARDRRHRNRRITAGLVAVTVALGSTLTAVAAFRDQPGTTPVDAGQTWQPPDTLTVWPESPVTGLSPADVQSAVDAGDPDLQWRLDPLTVGERFARGILGWVDVDAVPAAMQNGISMKVTLVPCPHSATCRPIGTLDVTLVQPATQGDGGIWSINAVTSRDLWVEVDVMDPEAGLAGGSSWGFDLTVSDAVSAHVGMAAANGCRVATAFDEALSSGKHQLTLPTAKDADPSCGRTGAGYLFAYATDDTTIPSPDPLAEPTAIEFPWITIVPIYLEMETGPSATATESTAVSGADTP